MLLLYEAASVYIDVPLFELSSLADRSSDVPMWDIPCAAVRGSETPLPWMESKLSVSEQLCTAQRVGTSSALGFISALY